MKPFGENCLRRIEMINENALQHPEEYSVSNIFSNRRCLSLFPFFSNEKFEIIALRAANSKKVYISEFFFFVLD